MCQTRYFVSEMFTTHLCPLGNFRICTWYYMFIENMIEAKKCLGGNEKAANEKTLNLSITLGVKKWLIVLLKPSPDCHIKVIYLLLLEVLLESLKIYYVYYVYTSLLQNCHKL